MRADAICFDKDGTLFDFAKTWDVWADGVIANLSAGNAELMGRIAKVIGYDLKSSKILPGSPIIADTNRQIAESFSALLSGHSTDEIEHYLMETAANAPLAPAVPLMPFLQDLAARGLALGVMTNDSEFGARAHLKTAGILDQFDFVAGFDSGHGSKPDPDPLLAFCAAVSSMPERAIMVGDSNHDLVAGRAAGMQTVGVLTGLAKASDLAPYADVILPDIGHLAGWLGD